MIIDWTSLVKPSGLAVSPGQVTRFEIGLGFELPDDYRTFLLEVNGGKVIPEHKIYSPELGCAVFVQYLYPFTAESPFLGVREARLEQVEARLCLRQALQIGGDLGTGFFYLMLAGPKEGSVFFIFKDDLPMVSEGHWDTWEVRIPDAMIQISSDFDDLGRVINANRCKTEKGQGKGS